MTLAEGLTFGAGAAVALGFSFLAASKSLSEEMTLDDYVAKVLDKGVFPFGPITAREGAQKLFEKGFTVEEARNVLTNHALGYAVANPHTIRSDRYYEVLKEAAGRSKSILELISRTDVDKGPIDKILKMSDQEADAKLDLLSNYGGRSSWVNDKTLKTIDFWYQNGFQGADLKVLQGLGGFGNLTGVKERSPEATKALLTIARKYKGVTNAFSPSHTFTEKDYARIAKLPFDTLPSADAMPTSQYALGQGRFMWDQYEADAKELLTKVPIPFMKAARVPPKQWLSRWRQISMSEGTRELFYKLAAVGEVIGDTKDKEESESLNWFFLRLWDLATTSDDEPFFHEEARSRIDSLAKLAKSGMLTKIKKAFEKSGETQAFLWENIADAYKNHGPSVFDSGWTSTGDLMEKIVLLDAGLPVENSEKSGLTIEQSKINRVRDRLAAQDPEWAISQFKNEYNRGKRIAPMMRDIVDHLEDLLRKGETLVVHGRDGELIYDLLMRRPGIPKNRVRYAITSRPLTTFASEIPSQYEADIPQNFRDYLGRMIPKGAVHVDTGFLGSIPRWLDDRGFEVKKIQMVSATRAEEQIPVKVAISDQTRRDVVLSDLEHSSQRLDNPLEGWGQLRYSYGAPGYHARKYGVYDALGIPRKKEKAQAPKQEERRYRIADEPSQEDEEDVEIESSQTKAFK